MFEFPTYRLKIQNFNGITMWIKSGKTETRLTIVVLHPLEKKRNITFN